MLLLATVSGVALAPGITYLLSNSEDSMNYEKLRSCMSALGMGLLGWAGLVLVLNLMMYMSTEGEMSFAEMWRMLPLSAILCFFPAVMMLADYLRPRE